VGNPDPYGGLYQLAQHLGVSFSEIQRFNPELAKKDWKLAGGEMIRIPLRDPFRPPPEFMNPRPEDTRQLDLESLQRALDGYEIVVNLDSEWESYLNSLDYYLTFHDVDWNELDPRNIAVVYIAILRAGTPNSDIFLQSAEDALGGYILEKVLPTALLFELAAAVKRPAFRYGTRKVDADFTKALQEALSLPCTNTSSRLLDFRSPGAWRKDPSSTLPGFTKDKGGSLCSIKMATESTSWSGCGSLKASPMQVLSEP
jgi:hypothetical protein